MTEEQWEKELVKAIGIFLNGEKIGTLDIYDNHVIDTSFFLLFNAEEHALEFTLPINLKNQSWKVVIDTSPTHWIDKGKVYQ
ncbi:hypothetical protein [Cyanobacterium sp. uoEpiScrs1]|uniref:hypothetical protein n=1 Tax=Cyanobacterium sp. uoEpiScrs1 TaxID=2976343 RepID=UPI00226A800E|nr:hypothetical protein [Cyanobacterium sp. uoEpiScrs1]